MDQDEMPGNSSDAADATGAETPVAQGPAEPAEECPETPAAAQAEPEPTEAPPAEPVEATPVAAVPDTARVSRWPFAVYGLAWLGLTAVAAWHLTRDPSLPAYQHELYPGIVLAGIAMVALGPAVGIGAWTGAWMGAPKPERAGLFTSAFLRASFLTFIGASLWWGMLVAVDAVRLGGL